jgi:predicted metalloprotease with PDZ domain
LWRRFGAAPAGFADDALQSLVEEAAGVALDDFFARCVRGRDELDVAAALRSVGLEVVASYEGEDEPGAQPAWLGALLKEDAALTVTSALDGGPAVAAGLYAGDEIVALDGFRVDLASLKERLATRKPGDRVALTVFRRDQLRTVELTLAARPFDKFSIAAVAAPTDEQAAAFQAWMGSPLATLSADK